MLKLKDGVSLDHEAGDTVTVTITATDDGDASLDQSVTITVNDLNEAPTAVSLSNATVGENAAGAAVGTVIITDPDDPAGAFGGHDVAVDDARFEIVDGVLKLKDGVTLDHEGEGSVTVTITATDDGGLAVVETFQIVVVDANEAPTAIGLSDTSVDEATTGAVVGTVAVSDPDDPAEPFGSHTITVDDDRFEVVGDTLKLRDSIALDHETGDQVTVTVTATDDGGASVSQGFVIAVNDVDEAPTTISLSNGSVDENVAGAEVGTLTVTDPDDPTGSFGMHSLAVSDWRFEVVDGALKLKPGFILDHEAGESVTVTVTATSGGGASLSQAFDIIVNDLNEVPSLPFGSFTVSETAGIGAVVGAVVGTDPDHSAEPFGTLTYDLTNDAGGLFTIDAATGEITTAAALDHEAAASHSIVVTVTDGGGSSASRSYTINVADINEAPTGISVPQAPAIIPDDTPGVYVGRVQVDDPDARWEPFGSNTLTVDDPRFELVTVYGSQYLKLKNGVSLDFQSDPTVAVAFTATDGTGMATTLTLDLEVIDTVAGQTFIPLGPLDGANGSRLFSSSPDDGIVGDVVNSAGDLNGDGYADIVIGSPFADGQSGLAGGAAHVVFGGPDGLPADVDLALLDGTDGFRLSGTPVFDGAGTDVSTLGDINGDGFDDLVVTAVQSAASAGGYGYYVQSVPASFVVFGKAAGWAADTDLSTLSGSDGFRIPATTEFGIGGLFVNAAGDVNGDGLDDMIIGDIYASPIDQFEGSSYVVFGKTDGWADTFDPTGLTGADGYRIDGISPGDFAGLAIGGGDINGDGFDDLAIGALGLGYGDALPASVYVVYGGPADQGPAISLGDVDGTNGFRVTGFDQSPEVYNFEFAGDLNRDGFDDLVISFSGYQDKKMYVVYGTAAGSPATVDVADLDGSNGFVISGTGINALGSTLNIVGDVNGDGFDDLLIGSRGSDNAPFGSPDSGLGAAYVVYGRGDGFGQSIDLARIDGTNGFRLDGVVPSGYAGASAAAAGDVDGDGLADLLIGARDVYLSYGLAGGGEVYLFNGGDFTSSITEMGTAGADTLTGTAAAESLVGAQGDDILVGNGGADVLYGGSGNDILAVGDLTFARIDGGSGDDTLRLDGAGQSLDLTSIGNTVIDGVERVDLTGSGDNSATLAITDLLQISDESNDLFVAGDVGDQVTVVGDWQNTGPTTVDGVTYDVFTVAGVEAALYVEDDVTVTVAATTGT